MQNSTHMFLPENPECFKVSAPAGKGLSGVASAPAAEKKFDKVKFVNAQIPRGWNMHADRRITSLGSLDTPVDLRHKRTKDGKDFPVMKKIILSAVVMAEEDGYVLMGAGLDWWWEFRVLKKGGMFSSDKMVPVYGRAKSIAGGNGSAAFSTNDWIFRVPVVKGANPVEIEVTLGECGFGSAGLLPASMADREISVATMKEYEFYRDNFPEPDKTFNASKSFGSWRFDTAQPYPAGIEYRVKGAKDWQSVWDNSCSKSHSVKLPEDMFKGKTVEMRIAQRAYFSGWTVIRSEIKTQTF